LDKDINVIYRGLSRQIVLFLVVGGFTFILDYLTMIGLIEIFETDYLISTGIGFILGSVVNYYLSIKYVFVSGKYKKNKSELLIFMVFTSIGLGLNHFIMYSGCDIINWDYRIVKIASLVIVTAFNFITKKIFVFIK
jgi:putative flippase GtrA